jgi:hypothetical protein
VIWNGKKEFGRVQILALIPLGIHFVLDKDRRMSGSWKEYFRANPGLIDVEVIFGCIMNESTKIHETLSRISKSFDGRTESRPDFHGCL